MNAKNCDGPASEEDVNSEVDGAIETVDAWLRRMYHVM